jgi:hypothetical protein
VREYGIKSIAIPPLGSGLGGLPWEAVRPLIERVASDLDDVEVDIYSRKIQDEPGCLSKTPIVDMNRSGPDLITGAMARTPRTCDM